MSNQPWNLLRITDHFVNLLASSLARQNGWAWPPEKYYHQALVLIEKEGIPVLRDAEVRSKAFELSNGGKSSMGPDYFWAVAEKQLQEKSVVGYPFVRVDRWSVYPVLFSSADCARHATRTSTLAYRISQYHTQNPDRNGDWSTAQCALGLPITRPDQKIDSDIATRPIAAYLYSKTGHDDKRNWMDARRALENFI